MSNQFNTVDVIGTESILKLIRQTKLCKFIIFRGGASSGSVPVFRATDTKTIDFAMSSFRDWAESVLRMNPYNNLPYDIFLYGVKVNDDEIDQSIKKKRGKDGEDEQDVEDLRNRRDRIRFSFSLNPYNNMSQNSGQNITLDQIAGIVNKTLTDRDEKNEMERLRAEVAELRNRRRSDDDDDDDEEEEADESGNALDRVYKVLKEVNKASLIKSGKFAEAGEDDDDDDDDDDADIDDDDDDDEGDESEDDAGSDDDDDGDDDDRAEKKEKQPTKEQSKKLERMKSALKILWKHDKHLDRDLMSLAKIAQKNPGMFSNYMKTLRNIDI